MSSGRRITVRRPDSCPQQLMQREYETCLDVGCGLSLKPCDQLCSHLGADLA